MKLVSLELSAMIIWHAWRDGLCYRCWPHRVVALLEIEPLLFEQIAGWS